MAKLDTTITRLDTAERDADTALKYSEDQARDDNGRWASGGGGSDSEGKGPAKLDAAGAKEVADRLAAGERPTISRADVRNVLAECKARSDDPDLTKLSVHGTLKFGGDGLGIARADMPQVPDDKREQFLKDLAKAGIKVTDGVEKPIDLKPVQKEISARKVGGILDYMRTNGVGKGSIFVSRDGYVLDGHHRWGAATALGFERDRVTIPVTTLGLDHTEALQWMLDWNTAQGVEHRGTGKMTWAEIEKRAREDEMAELRKYSEAQERDEHGRWAAGDGGAPTPPKGYSSEFNREHEVVEVYHDHGARTPGGAAMHDLVGTITPPTVGESERGTGRFRASHEGDRWSDSFRTPIEAAQALTDHHEMHAHDNSGPWRTSNPSPRTGDAWRKSDEVTKYSESQARDERGRFEGGPDDGKPVGPQIGTARVKGGEECPVHTTPSGRTVALQAFSVSPTTGRALVSVVHEVRPSPLARGEWQSTGRTDETYYHEPRSRFGSLPPGSGQGMMGPRKIDKALADLDTAERAADLRKYSPDQERDDHGRFGSGGGTTDSGVKASEFYRGPAPRGMLCAECGSRAKDVIEVKTGDQQGLCRQHSEDTIADAKTPPWSGASYIGHDYSSGQGVWGHEVDGQIIGGPPRKAASSEMTKTLRELDDAERDEDAALKYSPDQPRDERGRFGESGEHGEVSRTNEGSNQSALKPLVGTGGRSRAWDARTGEEKPRLQSVKDHPVRHGGITPDNRLVCRDCGEGIVGARTNFTGGWVGGVHESDFRAGNFTMGEE